MHISALSMHYLLDIILFPSIHCVVLNIQQKGLKMTTQKNKQSTSQVITDKELGNKLTKALATLSEEDKKTVRNLSVHYKNAMMVVMLSRSEGATLKEIATQLNWKENSVRGAMSLLVKKQTDVTLTSQKKDGVRTYYLKPKAE